MRIRQRGTLKSIRSVESHVHATFRVDNNTGIPQQPDNYLSNLEWAQKENRYLTRPRTGPFSIDHLGGVIRPS